MDAADKSEVTAPLDTGTFNEVQLLLAEKRTSLSAMRTGIAVFAFPLSVLSVLIATSKAYEMSQVMHWLVPLVGINLGLIALAVYLTFRALRKMWHYDRLIAEYKHNHVRLAKLLA